jgi:hypothetical protein
MWAIVALVVMTTVAVTVGTLSSHSQSTSSVKPQQTVPENPFGDLRKFPIAKYNAPEPANAAEREDRRIKGKRHDAKLPVTKVPAPDAIAEISSDAEPIPKAIPADESSLVAVGTITEAEAFLSNEKKGIYSEYTIRIQTILKEDPRKKLKPDDTVTADRSGGVVEYPNGQLVLYRNSWQALPEVGARYLLFLGTDDDKNPNYRILTAYQLKDGNIAALDYVQQFKDFDGTSETDFIKLVQGKQ